MATRKTKISKLLPTLAILALVLTACSEGVPLSSQLAGSGHPYSPNERASGPVTLPTLGDQPAAATDEFGNGMAEIRLRVTGGPGVIQVRARYEERYDVSGYSEQIWELETSMGSDGDSPSLSIPLDLLINDSPRTLRDFKIWSADGKHQIDTPENIALDSLRLKATKGVALVLELSKKGDAIIASRVSRASIPPLALEPDTRFMSLTVTFAALNEILASEDTEGTLDRLRDAATATEAYHRELLALVTDHTAPIDVAHLSMLLDAFYFNAEATERLKAAVAVLSSRRDGLSAAQLKTVSENLALANRMAPLGNQLILAALPRLTALDATQAGELLRRSFETENASRVFESILARFPNPTTEERLAVVSIAKAKNQPAIASRVAADWFTRDSNHSAEELLGLAQDLPEADAEALLVRASPNLKTADAEEVKALLSMLVNEAAIREAAPRIIALVPNPSASQYLKLLGALPFGLRRDPILIATIASVPDWSTAEARSVMKLVYLPSTHGPVAAAVFAKMPKLSAPKILDVAGGSLRGEARDLILIEGLRVLDAIESVRVIELMGLASDASKQRGLFDLGITRLRVPLKIETALEIARAIGESPNADRDACLERMAGLVKELKSSGLKTLKDEASTAAARDAIERAGRSRVVAEPAPGPRVG